MAHERFMVRTGVIILLLILGCSSAVAKEDAAQPLDDWMININTADAAELMQLPGIGVVKAQRIVDFRTTHGQFETIEDIMNVKGIGVKTFMKFKDRITVANELKKSRAVEQHRKKLITWGKLKCAR